MEGSKVEVLEVLGIRKEVGRIKEGKDERKGRMKG